MAPFIARHWHGHCPVENSEKFWAFLKNEVANIPGKLAAYIHHTETGDLAHFYVCTFWEDFDSLKEFSGDNVFAPVSDPFDIECGVVSDSIVSHFKTTVIKNPYQLSL